MQLINIVNNDSNVKDNGEEEITIGGSQQPKFKPFLPKKLPAGCRMKTMLSGTSIGSMSDFSSDTEEESPEREHNIAHGNFVAALVTRNN